MTETVVHVTTLEQWKSVLDVWFNQGYEWVTGDKKYSEHLFIKDRFTTLVLDHSISYSNINRHNSIRYSRFIAQQKEDNKMATVYEVSQSVFDELQRIKAHEGTSLIGAIAVNTKYIKSIEVGNKAILRYLADDPAIEFKVKEPLYRLWRKEAEEIVYMATNPFGTPTSTSSKEFAFKASLEKITKWDNPAWNIEKVDD